MPFDTPYQFGRDREVVIKGQKYGKFLRVSPNNIKDTDGNGGKGAFAQWFIDVSGGNICRIKSKKTGKYLRIDQGGKDVDVQGTGGPFTTFRIHRQNNGKNIAKLESIKFPGCYVAIQPGGKVRVGNGGPFTIMHFFCDGQVKNTGNNNTGDFSTPYQFGRDREVVIKGEKYGKFLRVNPNNIKDADGNGGKGAFAQWFIDVSGGNTCQIKSKKTGKYLRIDQGGKDVDVQGTGGPFTTFVIHRQKNNIAKLESVKFPGCYVAIQPGGVVRVGNGGPYTVMHFFCNGQIQNTNNNTGSFNKPYVFARDNSVVIKGEKYGKFLRVSPNDIKDADGNGGKGLFAQWFIDVQGGNICRIKSKKTGKYLRIDEGGRDVDVQGTGGPFTTFKIHRQNHGKNIAKLESCKFSNCYVAIQPGGKVRVGNGGPYTVLHFFRD